MKAMKKLAVSCVAVVALAGCYKHSFTVGRGGNVNADPAYSSSTASFRRSSASSIRRQRSKSIVARGRRRP
jgi:hypothetical protein